MKFFELVKEVLYDIVGYIFPGIFILLLLCISINDNIIKLPTYSFLTNMNCLSTYTSILKYQTSDLPALLIFSYILGHIPKAIMNITCFEHILKRLNKKAKKRIDCKFNYLFDLENNITLSLKDKLQIKFSNNKNFKEFLSTYATTTSRFENHNNLIQKYIAKSNFYRSFSTIFFLLFCDSIISLIYYLIINKFNRSLISFKLIGTFIMASILFFILFKGFYFEFIRHEKLKYKESLLFLYVSEKKQKMN